MDVGQRMQANQAWFILCWKMPANLASGTHYERKEY
jgi:hypothetical protein